MFISDRILAEAGLLAILAFSLAGFCILAWRHRRAEASSAAAGAAADKVQFAEAALQLDREAASILRLVRSYLDAGERYSVTLARAGESLPTEASREEIAIIVKFLLAENAKMQHEAGELKKSLVLSRSQVDKLRSHLAEAQEIGMRDPLTDLGNRRRFEDSLERELAEARRRGTALSLVMGDIDNFKTVNDHFGHQIGDEILKTVAGVLLDNVSDRDTVARYGGEEFAIILPETRIESARQLTERIRSQLEALELAVNASGQRIGSITGSFGIAELEADDDALALVRRTDARLYAAKSAGRNRIAAAEPAAA